MDWIQNHADTVLVLLTIMGSWTGALIWINGKFNDLDKRLTIIETVMMCKGIIPNQMSLVKEG